MQKKSRTISTRAGQMIQSVNTYLRARGLELGPPGLTGRARHSTAHTYRFLKLAEQ